MIKKITGLLLCLITSQIMISQNNKSDWYVNKVGDTIKCNITEFKAKSITIKTEDKITSNVHLREIEDLFIKDISIIENPLNLNISKPESGYANVYFYRTYKYTGSALPCKIKHNDKLLINLKTKSYFVHKVKTDEIHKYYWSGDKKDVIEINAQEGKSYYIVGGFGAKSGIGKVVNLSNRMSIALDNPNTGKYSVLRMKKKSKEY